ncbi:MAG: hypothetical protein ABFS39_04510 [Pseudomonadota bacterium]
MRRPGSKQRRIVIMLLALLTFGIAYYGGNRHTEDESLKISGVLLRPAMPVPEFELEDQHGNSFSKQQLEDHWSLILLDPNRSSDSPALVRLVQIHNRLAIQPAIQQKIRFVYVPRQPATLTLAAGLGAGFFSLSGDAVDLHEAFSRFGVSDTEDGFTLYLIDPDARIRVLFTGGQDTATIASDLITLISNHRS